MICECGGVLLVISIEEPPAHLMKERKFLYNRVCDVQCQTCGKIHYSQTYDDGTQLNLVKATKKI